MMAGADFITTSKVKNVKRHHAGGLVMARAIREYAEEEEEESNWHGGGLPTSGWVFVRQTVLEWLA